MNVMGIDPGVNTGVAVFKDGALHEMLTIEPEVIADLLRDRMPQWVVFEDSRLERRTWTARTKTNQGTALATARSIGMVDAWCRQITYACQKLGIQCIGISPTRKGAKMNAETFGKLTGWVGRTNQHQRDAAAVVLVSRLK